MMARRRQSLGSSIAKHNSEIGRLRAVADHEAKYALDLLRANNCNGAIHAVVRSAFAAGRADANAQSAGHGVQAYSIVSNAQEKVADQCAPLWTKKGR